MMRFNHLTYIAKILSGLMVLLMLLPGPVQAQEPVVYGLFFYSPFCSHCHEVMDNHWPGIQEEFGDQLHVIFIDVSTQEGSQIMRTVVEALQIRSTGVPTLIIGSEMLVGSIEIPQRAPGIIRAGLAAGGVGYPAVPGIERLFEPAVQVVESVEQTAERRLILDDPANLLAVIVLVGLVGSLGMVGTAVWRWLALREQGLLMVIASGAGWWMMLVGTLIGIALAVSLFMGSFSDGSTLVLSAAVLVIFLTLIYNLFRNSPLSRLSSWVIPLIITAGLLVAGYLAYVETTLTEATCGIVGDCNIVQQSPYARILGIPIGVIGVIAYIAMLLTWTLGRYGNWRKADWALFTLAVAGVGFSIYLTFLEPFVIGASCLWCLTSAVIMTMLLWLSLPVEQLVFITRKR